MRNLIDIALRQSGTPMRHPAFYVTYPNGRAFPMQLREGLCLVVFGTRERARAWMDAILKEPQRSGCRIGTWTTVEQVERWMEREGKNFHVVSPNPDPDPRAQVFYEPIGTVLRIARGEAAR